MTAADGFGMLLISVTALTIAAIIAFFIIRKIMKEDIKPTRFDDLE